MIRRVLRRLKYRYWIAYYDTEDGTEVYLMKRFPPITRNPRTPVVINGVVEGPYTREQVDIKWAKITEDEL